MSQTLEGGDADSDRRNLFIRVSGASTRLFVQLLGCCCRSCETLILEPTATDLRLRALNASRTTHLAVTVPATAFSEYVWRPPRGANPANLGVVPAPGVVTHSFSVESRALLASALRSSHGLTTLEITHDETERPNELQVIAVHAERGYSRCYAILLTTAADAAPRPVVSDGSRLLFAATADAKVWTSLLGVFPGNAPTVTIFPEKGVLTMRLMEGSGAGGGGGGRGGARGGAAICVKAEQFALFRYPALPPPRARATRTEEDGDRAGGCDDEEEAYERACPCGKSIELRPFRYMCFLATQLRMNLRVCIGGRGSPVVMECALPAQRELHAPIVTACVFTASAVDADMAEAAPMLAGAASSVMAGGGNAAFVGAAASGIVGSDTPDNTAGRPGAAASSRGSLARPSTLVLGTPTHPPQQAGQQPPPLVTPAAADRNAPAPSIVATASTAHPHAPFGAGPSLSAVGATAPGALPMRAHPPLATGTTSGFLEAGSHPSLRTVSGSDNAHASGHSNRQQQQQQHEQPQQAAVETPVVAAAPAAPLPAADPETSAYLECDDGFVMADATGATPAKGIEHSGTDAAGSSARKRPRASDSFVVGTAAAANAAAVGNQAHPQQPHLPRGSGYEGLDEASHVSLSARSRAPATADDGAGFGFAEGIATGRRSGPGSLAGSARPSAAPSGFLMMTASSPSVDGNNTPGAALVARRLEGEEEGVDDIDNHNREATTEEDQRAAQGDAGDGHHDNGRRTIDAVESWTTRGLPFPGTATAPRVAQHVGAALTTVEELFAVDFDVGMDQIERAAGGLGGGGGMGGFDPIDGGYEDFLAAVYAGDQEEL